MNKKAIIFDIDGTMWDSSEQVAESWNLALKDLNVNHVFTADEIKQLMGKPLEEIFTIVFPFLNDETRYKYFKMCSYKEIVYLIDHPGKVFDGLKDVLDEIHGKYDVYIVSNCQNMYIDSFIKGTHLGYYFDDYVCHGENGLCKADNIKAIMARNGISEAIYVGDTLFDFESAKKAGVPFVHANYGFEKNVNSKYKINNIKELLNVIKEIWFES